MAVQQVVERPGRSLTNDKGIVTAQRVFTIRAELGDKEDAIATWAGSPSLPKVGQLHDVGLLWCIRANAKQTDKSAEWVYTADYSDEVEMAEDPTDDPVEIEWETEIYTEAVFKDKDDNAIVNSAGDYFIDPSPTREKSHLIAKVKKNVDVVPTWAITLRDVVNSAAVTIDGLSVGAGLALVKRLHISKVMTRNGIDYREVTFEVHIHKDGWAVKPLDAGFREKISNEMHQITNDGDGSEPTTPVPLDGSGRVLTDPTPSTAVFGTFNVYSTADLTQLPGIS